MCDSAALNALLRLFLTITLRRNRGQTEKLRKLHSYNTPGWDPVVGPHSPSVS
jgi:hypothetical protein